MTENAADNERATLRDLHDHVRVVVLEDGSAYTEPLEPNTLADAKAEHDARDRMLAALSPEERAPMMAQHPTLSKMPVYRASSAIDDAVLRGIEDGSVCLVILRRSDQPTAHGGPPVFRDDKPLSPVVGPLRPLMADGIVMVPSGRLVSFVPTEFARKLVARDAEAGIDRLAIVEGEDVFDLRRVAQAAGDVPPPEDPEDRARLRAQLQAMIDDGIDVSTIQLPRLVQPSPLDDGAMTKGSSLGRFERAPAQLKVRWARTASLQAIARDADRPMIRNKEDDFQGGLAQALITSARMQINKEGRSLQSLLKWWSTRMPGPRPISDAERDAIIAERSGMPRDLRQLVAEKKNEEEVSQ